MLEKNRHILKDLLRQMPEYSPSDQVWEGIEESLSSPAPTTLDRLLPAYQPPDRVWEQIEAQLPAPGSAFRRLLPWISAAAASAAVLYWFFLAGPLAERPAEMVALTYSKEVVDDALLQRDWQDDEGAFDLVEKMCTASPFTCTNPDMNTLRTELDELTEAKLALEEAIGAYGTDIDLIGQLTEIERQRTALLKKMLEYFI